MTGWEFWLQTAGVVFQVFGLVAVAVGIGTAWAENAAHEDRLLARIFGPPIRFIWVKVLRRRPRPRSITLAVADVAMAVEVSSVVITRGLNPNDTAEDQLRQVKGEVDQAWTKANEANAAAERAQKAVDRLAAYVDRQDAAVQDTIKDQARTETVEGIPLAVVGLAATALGTVFQYAAAFFG